MKIAHGFFISEFEYIKDLKGLLNHLASKISVGLQCIYCENKGYKDFKYPEAVQSHMLDK